MKFVLRILLKTSWVGNMLGQLFKGMFMLRKIYLIGYLITAGMVVFALSYFPKWTVDDAYITYRYAYNLATFGELTFNAGFDPVEGYTGVLLPILIGGAIFSGINPEVASHLIGVVSFIGLIIVFYSFLKELRVCGLLRMFITFVFSTAAWMYTHAFSGLETMLFLLLIMTNLRLMYELVKRRSISISAYSGISVTLFLLAACRPEGAVLSLIIGAVLGLYTLFCLKAFRPVVALFLVLGIPGLIYFYWRMNYYGYLLPNTFYSKLSGSFSEGSLKSFLKFIRYYLLLPLIACSASGVVAKFKGGSDKRDVRGQDHLAMMLMFGSFLIYSGIVIAQYLRSALIMNYSYRFFVPLYPPLLLLCAYSLAHNLKIISASVDFVGSKGAKVFFGMLGILFCIQVSMHAVWYFDKEVSAANESVSLFEDVHHKLAIDLRDRIPDSEWLVVHIDAGAVPFYSRLNTVDFGALNDEFLAHHKDAPLVDRLDYFFSRNPGALVFTSYDWDTLRHGESAAQISADSRFSDYTLVEKYGSDSYEDYFQFLYLRNDLKGSWQE